MSDNTDATYAAYLAEKSARDAAAPAPDNADTVTILAPEGDIEIRREAYARGDERWAARELRAGRITRDEYRAQFGPVVMDTKVTRG